MPKNKVVAFTLDTPTDDAEVVKALKWKYSKCPSCGTKNGWRIGSRWCLNCCEWRPQRPLLKRHRKEHAKKMKLSQSTKYLNYPPTKGKPMSLVVPTQFTKKPEKTELQEMAEAGRKRARRDFEQEQAEQTIKEAYETELSRLRTGGSPVSQSKPALHSNPPQTKEPSPMQRQLDRERQANAIQAQTPFVPDSTPVAPSPVVSEEEAQFAVKVIEVWKESLRAQKDFPNVAAFHAFCLECASKEKQLKPHHQGIVGLPYYQKLINLQKGPGSRR